MARMHGRILRSALVLGLLSLSGLLVPQTSAAATAAVAIEPTGPAPTLPAYIGSAANARPLTGMTLAWQDPFMSPNPRNSVHNDAWQSDNYTQWGGPLGNAPQVLSTAIGRDCITLSFDHKGRLISTCQDLTHGPGLYLIDPRTLATLAFMQLPHIPAPAGTDPATNTTGGAYFYLDQHDRVVVAASDRHILVIAVAGSAANGGRGAGGQAPYFRQVADYNPISCLTPGDRIPSVLPDAQGRLWFVGRYHGAVGVLDTRTGKCRSVILGEEVENSFAIGSDGTYIVSDKAMYKFRAGKNLVPKQIWRMPYANIEIQKPGQFNAGSGSTPTLIGPLSGHHRSTTPAYVAITDNADPMDVVVYRTGDRLQSGHRRVVCTVPVFAKGASADENSLISIGRSLIVENNYGYVLQKFNDVISGGPGKPPVPIGGNLGLLSAPGMDRIDINADGSGCRIVWRNNTVRTPSAVSKGDSANGLIYTFQKIRDRGQPGAGVWYWTALDYRTGKVVWMRRAGYGGLYNNHYSGIAVERNPLSGATTLYLGGIGGVMALRDG